VTDPVRFKRAALLVADLDRSLAVYRDALGFTLESIKNSPTDSYSYEIFGLPEDAKLRMAALDGPSDQPRTLALLEVRPALPPQAGPRAATVVYVADIDAALDRLRRIDGVRLLPERELRTHDGKLGREVGVIDPDGHAIVLYHV
jgi:catechol 2,3-dioxygenase-like lactoylglutathione lyase family enzyme